LQEQDVVAARRSETALPQPANEPYLKKVLRVLEERRTMEEILFSLCQGSGAFLTGGNWK